MAWSHVKQVLENDELRGPALLKTVPRLAMIGLALVLSQYWAARDSGADPHYWLAALVVGLGFPFRLYRVATDMVAPPPKMQRLTFTLYLLVFLTMTFISIWFFLKPT